MTTERETTKRPCGRNGLLIAGLTVTAIGLALVAGDTLHLPRHWQTVAVGIVLIVAGALRRSIRRSGQASRGNGG